MAEEVRFQTPRVPSLSPLMSKSFQIEKTSDLIKYLVSIVRTLVKLNVLLLEKAISVTLVFVVGIASLVTDLEEEGAIDVISSV